MVKSSSNTVHSAKKLSAILETALKKIRAWSLFTAKLLGNKFPE
jgi:hypothetical protein